MGSCVGQFPTRVSPTLPSMLPLTLLQAGVLLAALGIALGAFGAHGLKSRLDPQMLATFEIGVRYHMYSALAVIALAPQVQQTRGLVLLLIGLLIFSGSLYILALTGMRWLGAVTPLGGLLLIAGLVMCALDLRR